MKINWFYRVMIIILLGNGLVKAYKKSDYYLNSKYGIQYNDVRIEKRGGLPLTDEFSIVEDKYYDDHLVFVLSEINNSNLSFHFKKVCILRNAKLLRELDYIAYRSSNSSIDSIAIVRSTNIDSSFVEKTRWVKVINKKLDYNEFIDFRSLNKSVEE